MADDEKQNQTERLKETQNAKSILSRIKERAIKRSRQYTLKDLNTLRHLPSYREMPTNLLLDPEGLIKAGLGLHTTSKGGFTLQYKTRQVQIKLGKVIPGYENFTKLIPRHRRTDKHPHTPKTNEIQKLSKRNFDARVKRWKRAIHEWDEITLESQIPAELLPKPIQKQQQQIPQIAQISPRRYTPRSTPPQKPRYKWSPKRKATTPSRPGQSEKASPSEVAIAAGIAAYIGADDENNHDDQDDGIKLFVDRDDEKKDAENKQKVSGNDDERIQANNDKMKKKAVYSPTRKAWYKPRRE